MIESGRDLLWCAAVLYTISFAFALSALVRNRLHNRPLFMVGLGIGLFLQSWGLYQRGMAVEGCPLGNPFEMIQFVTWSAMVLYFVIGPVFRMSLLGFFSAAMASVGGLASLAFPALDSEYEIGYFGGDAWIEAHAALAVFSYGIFGVLALTSLMYLSQNYGLKKQRGQGVFRFLPSIFELDQVNFRLLVLGVLIFSLSLIPGWAYWVNSQDTVTTFKLISTVAVWLAYLTLLIFRLLGQVSASRLSLIALFLFLVALLSLAPVDRSRYLPEQDGVENQEATS
ncbi:MAG: cytochrome c biogenesis protein CcsA [Verrucomicrobiota bacterium]